MKLLLNAGAVVTNKTNSNGQNIWEDPINDLNYCLEDDESCEHGFDKIFRMIQLLLSNFDQTLPEEFQETYDKAVQKFNEKSSAHNIAELDSDSASNVANFLGGRTMTRELSELNQIIQRAFHHENATYEQELALHLKKISRILE